MTQLTPNHLFTNQVEGLARSVDDFYTRFGINPTVNDTANALAEELQEFSDSCYNLVAANEAWKQRQLPNPVLARRDAALELADVFYTLLGHSLNLGIDLATIQWALTTKIRENDAKNHDTHVVLTLESGARKIHNRAKPVPPYAVGIDMASGAEVLRLMKRTEDGQFVFIDPDASTAGRVEE